LIEKFSNIDEVRETLNRIPKFSTDGQAAANFNLDRMRVLCEIMGNPQNNFESIHVAGTNGKGTICRLLSSIYQNAGYKTALYTSPHLERVEERFRINTTEISEEKLIQFFRNYGNTLLEGGYTFFEITTAIAFWFFSTEDVDLAIIETGLGGRLDATNVIQPIATVISSVGIDHSEILGDTIPAIAAEKGGIIKNEVPVFIGDLKKEAYDVILQIAQKSHSELIPVDSTGSVYKNGKVRIKSGNGQLLMYSETFKEIDLLNILLCLNVVSYLQPFYPVEDKEFREGVETMTSLYTKRAVFERLDSNLNWYFDGAHNADAVTHLVQHLKQLAPKTSWNVVLSFMSDKLSEELAKRWSDFDSIFVYEMPYDRAAKIDELLTYFPSAKVLNEKNLNNLNDLKSELVIFSGSFYFYTIARRWLGTLNAS
tara:strand:+ start:42248 stop:43525 length:1278 start_codon:yes stop_codon:yes gene_type:complete